jgi:multiple sugar transport system substrate-binding protein
MTSLEFSLIPDSDADLAVMRELMGEFRQESGVEVVLKPLEWNTAWQELMVAALQGRGADISHVGSTWVSSLTAMNSLYAFRRDFLRRIGGGGAFLAPNWSTSGLEGEDNTWSLPWTTYAYAIVYRRDLLQEAGIKEAAAFDTPAHLANTLAKLTETAGVDLPWTMPLVDAPSTDYLHIAASWVWASGGDFMDAAGKKVSFDQPSAASGFIHFIDAQRRNSAQGSLYDGATPMNDFLAGKAAAALTDLRTVNTAHLTATDRTMIDKMGVATVLNTPWCGGGNLVLWRHVQGEHRRLQAALDLVEFLLRDTTLTKLSRLTYTLPARKSSLAQLFPPDHIVSPVITRIETSGRGYRPLSLWHRVEIQLAEFLNPFVNEVLANPDADIAKEFNARLAQLAKRLNLALS